MASEIVKVEKHSLATIPEQLKGVAVNTKLTYSNALGSYTKFLSAHNLQMDFDSVEKWLYSIENPKTQNTYLQAIKKILREMYKDDPRGAELEKNLSTLKVAKVDDSITESDYLTFKEVQKLLKKSPKMFSLIIESLFWSGCRISELINIKLKKCEKQKTVYAITVLGKGSKERIVYMPGELFNKINAYFDGTEYLFEHRGKKYNRSYLSNKIKEFGFKILDRKISAHTLRHSKVMYLKDVLKLSPDQIQKAVGHADVATTLTHYYHGTPSAADQGIK